MGAVFSLSLPSFIKQYRAIQNNKNINKTRTVNLKNKNTYNLNKFPYII